MSNVKSMIETEEARAIEKLKTMKPEDPGYKNAVEAIAVLQKARLEEEKNEFEDRKHGDELELRTMENEAKVEEAKIEKRRFILKTIIDGAAIVIPAGIYLFFGVKGFKFEQSGTFCSQTNKWNLGNVFKFRR